MIMICFIYVGYYYLFYLYQETDDNQKVNADRKSLADGIVDLLMSAVPCLQVSDESVKTFILLKLTFIIKHAAA